MYDCCFSVPLKCCLLSPAEAPADGKPEEAPSHPAVAPVQEETPAPAQAEGKFIFITQ